MNRAITALGTPVLLGGSLLLGTAPAQAIEMPGCPSTMHLVMDPGSTNTGTCVPNPGTEPTGPLASGNNWSIWAGSPTDIKPGPAPVQPPPYKPLPAPAAPGQAAQGPSGDARPGNAATGSLQEPNWSPAVPDEAPAGETLQSQTTVQGQVPVEGQAPAETAATAVILPATEAQAVTALRSGTATTAEKDAALVIVKARIDAVLSKALDSALARH